MSEMFQIGREAGFGNLLQHLGTNACNFARFIQV